MSEGQTLVRETDITGSSGWSITTLRDYFLGLLGAYDRRLTELVAASDARSAQEITCLRTSMREHLDREVERHSIEATALNKRFELRDLTITQRFDLHEAASNVRFTAQEVAVDKALGSAKEAVNKAESAIEKRLENTNEWRNSINDRERYLMPRAEAEVLFKALKESLADLTVSVAENRANAKGQVGGWSLAIGAVGLIATMASLISLMKK